MKKAVKRTRRPTRQAEDNIVQVIVNESTEARPVLKKAELYSRVAEATGMPRNQVRRALDGALNEIRAALLDGTDVRLPPLGKLRAAGAADNKGRHQTRLVIPPEAPAEQGAEKVAKSAEPPLEAAGE